MRNIQKRLFGLSILVLSLIGCSEAKKSNSDNNDIRLVNRELVKSDTPNEILLAAKESDGLAILEEVSFSSGTIEIDLRGENAPGQSFVGFAFNIQNDSTYEAIYFRPFNFHQEEQIRREHSIQYVFHPTFNWRKLRTEQEGVFEAAFPAPPNADDWFTVRLAINSSEVQVLNANGDLLLKVDRLSEPLSGKVGYWTGNNSKGAFRNLQILQ